MEADRLARLGLDRPVELERVLQEAHEVVAPRELRAEPRCVPGRAARQLRLLQQDRVGPAELRQVVEHGQAADSASDDRDLRLGEHAQRVDELTLVRQRRERVPDPELGSRARLQPMPLAASIDAFYLTFAQIAFALLGLWWIVLQLKYTAGAGERRRRRHAYGVTLFFLIPGVMALLSSVDTAVGELWRLAFGVAGAIGIVEAALYLASEGGRTRAGTAVRVAGLAVYVLIVLFAIHPGLAGDLGGPLGPQQIEAILLGVLLVIGVHVAWLSLTESEETAGA